MAAQSSVQWAFTALLLAVLVGAAGSFVLMGLRQARRTGRLARQAHQRGLRFSAGDPFDVPRRYADFAAIRSGHSPCAHNVTYGRVGGLPVRAFDFRYEIGHGTARATRHGVVAVVETEDRLPTVLAWNDPGPQTPGSAPPRPSGRVAGWGYVGDDSAAQAGVGLCADLARDGGSFEVLGKTLLLCIFSRRRAEDYFPLVDLAPVVLRAICRHGSGGGTARQAVENGPASC